MEEQGPPEVLRLKDVADPSPVDDEVVIRVKAAGLNRIDIWIRSGLYKLELPRIIGVDVAGVVEKAGPRVSSVNVGDRVVVDPALYDDECRFCKRGWTAMCEKHRMVGFHVDGGYAELVKVPARNVYHIPSGVGFEEAAAIPVNFLTVWHNLFVRARVEAGDYVLVVGAGSGIGYAAIQLAKLAGATVITTVGDEWKAQKARELGADYVINRKKENVAERVNEITNGRGVDLVFEHAGQAMWDAAVKSLRPGGTMVFCGATTGDTTQINIRLLYRKQLNLHGAYAWNRDAMEKVLQLFAERKLKAVVDSVMPLEDAVKAHKRMENSEHFGKIILRP